MISLIPSTIDTAGLLSRWLLDGNANDSVSTRHGTWTGTARYRRDIKLGGQLVAEFNGSSYIAFSPSGLPGGSAIGTICALAKFRTAGNSGVIGYGTGGGSNTRAIFRYSATASICGYLNSSNINTGLDPNSDGSWHHIALAYNGASAQVYVGGVLYASSSITATTALTIGEIGRAGESYSMLGSICDCRIYNVAKTAAQVLSMAKLEA